MVHSEWHRSSTINYSNNLVRIMKVQLRNNTPPPNFRFLWSMFHVSLRNVFYELTLHIFGYLALLGCAYVRQILNRSRKEWFFAAISSFQSVNQERLLRAKT